MPSWWFQFQLNEIFVKLFIISPNRDWPWKKSLKQPQAPVVGPYPATFGTPIHGTYLEHPGHRQKPPTSAMVEATSASMATGCPNKPRNAVQKEGKVSSSNVLDPWIPWIPRKKNDMLDIFHAIFWLQIYLPDRKRKRLPQRTSEWVSLPINFSGAKKLPKMPNRKDLPRWGFPGCSFFMWGPTTLSWGPLLMASRGPTLYILYIFFFQYALPAELLQSLFQQQKKLSWHIPVSQAFATRWANDPRVTKPWCGFVVSWNFSSWATLGGWKQVRKPNQISGSGKCGSWDIRMHSLEVKDY